MPETAQIETFDQLLGVLRQEPQDNFRPDPTHFLGLIQDHRLISRVAVNAGSINDEALKEAITAGNLANKVYQLKLVSVLHEINTFLSSIPFMVLKGPVLSQLLYDDPAERTSRDLDILIEKENFDSALSLFEKQGYQLLTKFNSEKQREAVLKHFHHVELLHPSGDVLVELHWNLTTLKTIRVNISELMQKTAAVTIGDTKYRTLDTFDLIGYLSIHGAFHAFFRLQWLTDIRDLRKRLNKGEESALLDYLDREGLGDFYLVALLIMEELFHIKVNPEWKHRALNSPTVKAFVKLSLEQVRKNDTFLYGPETYGGLEKTLKNHRIQYHAGGFKGLIKSLVSRNVRPENWEFYVFPDKMFGLNHLFSRVIWFFRRLRKKNR